MAEETQQQNEVPQPPPLTQGRMYEDAIEYAANLFGQATEDNHKEFDAAMNGYLSAAKKYHAAVPHTPAPAVSDGNYVTLKIDSIDMGNNVVLSNAKGDTFTAKSESLVDFLSGVAATPAPIAGDGEQQ